MTDVVDDVPGCEGGVGRWELDFETEGEGSHFELDHGGKWGKEGEGKESYRFLICWRVKVGERR